MLNFFKKNIVINGNKIKAHDGLTILQAASLNGISIPTLCHIQGQLPTGVCRVCVVEVAGSRTLMGACHTPVSEGMVVQTHSPKVIAARKVIVELMLTSHTGDCMNDANAENCYLHNLASDHEVGAPRFNVKAPRFYPAEEDNPFVKRNLAKCILCRKCVQACRDMAGKNMLSIGYRGFRSKVVAGFDEPLTSEICRDCGVCVEHCPTGALSAAPGLKVQAKVQTGGKGK
jgi:NADH dehydrogenase/NADH:ubiquinone oxidoreductase subunit G